MSEILVRDPESMPLDCALYILIQQSIRLQTSDSRSGLREDIFVSRVQNLLDESCRRYTLVFLEFQTQAELRGYHFNTEEPTHSWPIRVWWHIPEYVGGNLKVKLTPKQRTHLYCDVVCDAIRACKVTDKNEFV